MDDFKYGPCLCDLCRTKRDPLDARRVRYVGGWEMEFREGMPQSCERKVDEVHCVFGVGGLVLRGESGDESFIPWHEIDRVRGVLTRYGR